MDLSEIFEEFQNGRHGDHVVYLKRIILPNLNLHISRCFPQSFNSIQHILDQSSYATLFYLDIFVRTKALGRLVRLNESSFS